MPRKTRLLALGAALTTGVAMAVTGLPAGAAPAPAAGPEPTAVPGRYIVTLTGKPVATYDGSVVGLQSTRPAKGKRVDPESSAARRYARYLKGTQQRIAARVGARPLRSFSLSVNGFSAVLTPAQARSLARVSGVLAVTKDVPRKADDDTNSVDFLKLTGKNGVWHQLGGAKKAGRGVVVGVIDTGYWPESKSFAGAKLGTAKPTAANPYRPYKSHGKIVMRKADGGTFKGVCQAGQHFSASECNTKVIGARYFSKAYETYTPPAARTDYLSPRDGDGHGSHTASTAAGNAGVPAKIGTTDFGSIAGVAPAAKLAIYKAGFTSADTDGQASFYTTDAIDAVEAAMTDGVDVINYSVSGSDDVIDPVDLAFLSAASAGIFVATSAGNDGPGASTLNHVVPWLTTVAASTVGPREGTVVLGNGHSYVGGSTTVQRKVGPASLVTAASVKATAADTADATLCAPGTLDPAKASGKIVVCDRGVVDRVAKSAEVHRVGGIGMVLVNLTENSVDGDTHSVPTVHVNVPDGPAIKAYAGTPGATAALEPGNLTPNKTPYPQIAGFSSRGPSLGTGGDLLKPDISAPGVAILAAVAPPTNEGRSVDFYSGTSMASPHVAGIAALFFGVHPRWAPMSVKSAIMTTASRLKDAEGKVSRDYYAQGAGNARPDRMFDPGVLFKSGDEDWLAFIEGEGYDTQTGVEAIDPSDYNSPSIALGSLAGSQTVTRRVTAVKPGLYRVSTSVPGVIADVSPSILTFSGSGQTKTIEVTFTRRTAPLGSTVFGSVYLRGAGTQARLPVAVLPKPLEAPSVVSGTGTSGSTTYSIKPGFTGAFPIQAYGLNTGPAQAGEVSAEDGVTVDYPTTVAAGTKVARFAVTSDDPAADIDLYVYRMVDGEPVEVGISGSPTGTESVTLVKPEPGQYLVSVAPFSDPPGQDASTFSYRETQVPPTAAGNFEVTPTSATVHSGEPFDVTASWTGLQSGQPYLGFVEYLDGSGTVVQVAP